MVVNKKTTGVERMCYTRCLTHTHTPTHCSIPGVHVRCTAPTFHQGRQNATATDLHTEQSRPPARPLGHKPAPLQPLLSSPPLCTHSHCLWCPCTRLHKPWEYACVHLSGVSWHLCCWQSSFSLAWLWSRGPQGSQPPHLTPCPPTNLCSSPPPLPPPPHFSQLSLLLVVLLLLLLCCTPFLLLMACLSWSRLIRRHRATQINCGSLCVCVCVSASQEIGSLDGKLQYSPRWQSHIGG